MIALRRCCAPVLVFACGAFGMTSSDSCLGEQKVTAALVLHGSEVSFQARTWWHASSYRTVRCVTVCASMGAVRRR